MVAIKFKQASICVEIMSDETSFKDAKAEYEYWLKLMSEIKDDDLREFRFKYKKGREPDVLAYLLLEEEERELIRN